MNPVILDTDVASHLHRRKLTGPLAPAWSAASLSSPS
jgi:hypothetical protein